MIYFTKPDVSISAKSFTKSLSNNLFLILLMVGKQCILKIEKAKYISTCGGGLNICGPLDVAVVEEVAVVALWAFCGDCGGTGG